MPNLALDSTFAGCRIEGVAGSGGMGIVYRATQLPLGRAVALKVVAPERAVDATLQARFAREARLAGAIDHPNVIPVYAAGEQEGWLYLVMRWVEGTDLQALISERGGLTPSHAAVVVAKVGSGLQAAHAAGLVHRDVKPANVLIERADDSEQVYLSDFGLTLEISASTRLTQTGELIGTVDFMAPEQFEGTAVDARTDVYALGCVLYAALTGRAPFARGTLPATMRAHLVEPPPRPCSMPGIPAAFDDIVARALAKRPSDRYSSASELVAAVLAAADSPAVLAGESPASGSKGGTAPGVAAQNGGESAETATPPGKTIALDDLRPMATARLSRARPRLARWALAAAVALAAGIGIAALLLLGVGPLGGDEGSKPLTGSEVRETAQAFALAYGREDDDALAGLLARDVARVTPRDAQRGRGAVLREYRRQFAANATKSYVLDDLEVRPGDVGRASGRYVASRSGREPITGRIVFGVRREGDRPRVGLIAATPDR
ncbi:MAG TPA: protein kinase [Thermoleophilaceae bacterium]|nr:protein kinase [Thermoleophilaceae bacterium]